jgi:CspA family cold shock protein
MSDTTDLNNIDGNVKWFDPRKGYGFIVGPQGQDIFVHFSVIDQAEGFKTLRDGEAVTYCASKGQKGWSATKVKSARVPSPTKATQPS